MLSNQLQSFLKVSARDELDALIESKVNGIQEVDAVAVEAVPVVEGVPVVEAEPVPEEQ